MKQIILLSGKKRSGKSLSGLLLKQIDPSVKLLAFAGPLKQIIADTFRIDLQELDDLKNSGHTVLHGVPPEDQHGTNFRMQTYREILQNFGTEGMKPIFGETVWADVAVKFIKHMLTVSDTVVLTDWRFTQELDVIQDNFPDYTIKTVRVTREGLELFDGHSSEIDLDDCNFDYVVPNNGTLEELKLKLEGILNG